MSQHEDDRAVDAFAVAMKAKMAVSRAKGRSGWQTCPASVLWQILREHVEKGDPVDVANLAMMIEHVSPVTYPQPEFDWSRRGEQQELETAYYYKGQEI